MLRGFDAAQAGLGLQRVLRVTEKVGLRLRGEFFNILNRPNFANPTNMLTSALFGRATQILANGAWLRRRQRRLHRPLPHQRPALRPTGAETPVLSSSAGDLGPFRVCRRCFFHVHADSEFIFSLHLNTTRQNPTPRVAAAANSRAMVEVWGGPFDDATLVP